MALLAQALIEDYRGSPSSPFHRLQPDTQQVPVDDRAPHAVAEADGRYAGYIQYLPHQGGQVQGGEVVDGMAPVTGLAATGIPAAPRKLATQTSYPCAAR